VSFMQNHDQIGNRAFGERLAALAEPRALEAAFAMLMLCPQIPLLFMGEERAAREPFQFFTSFHDELADAVREGRRSEFASARAFSDPAVRHTIPDPNDAATYERSRVVLGEARADDEIRALARTRRLLELRAKHIVNRLEGARTLGADAVGPKAAIARWHMGDGAVLTIAVNLAAEPVPVDSYRFRLRGTLLYTTPSDSSASTDDGTLPGYSTWVVIEAAT
jgi:maltooligosyltrehalose trehalohydrolase